MRTRAFLCALLALLIIGPTLGVAAVALAQDRPAAAQGAPPAAGPAAAAPAAPAAAPPAAPPKIDSGDTAWMLTSAALVLMMTAPGLALFYGGMVRRKNVLATLMQSFIILALISIQWILWGYSLAFSPDAFKGLIGGLDWFALRGVGLDPNPDYAKTIPHQAFMIYQMMFAVITPALITGAFAERVRFGPFLVFTLLWATLIYDPMAHWVWGDGGWMRKMGALDFAGGTVVHISSGVSALAMALVVGKRRGYGQEPMPPHNLTLTVLGAGLLWMGWFGFNAGSALGANALAASAFVATHVATAAAALSWMFWEWIMKGKPTVLGAASGAVAGLVAVTPASGFVTPLGAMAIGIVAGVLCYGGCVLKVKLGYDDSLDVVGVHGIGGTWGALATGLFATKAINPDGNNGAFHGNPDLFLTQAIAVGATWAFAFIGTLIIAKVVDAVVGLRAGEEEEQAGLDLSLHGESAYAFGGEGGVVGGMGFAPARRERPAEERRPAVAAPAPAEPVPALAHGGRRPPTATSRRPPEAGAAPAPARAAPPAPPPPPAGKPAPPAVIQDRPFRIVVKNVDRREIRDIWQHLCHEYPHKTPPDFNEIYGFVQTFSDDTFAFKKGDPNAFKHKIESLLYLHGLEGAVVTVEE